MPAFVIVVDAQRDFMLPDGALYVAGAEALVAPIDAWLAALTPVDADGVLLTFDTHDAETYPLSAEAAQFPLHCVRGSVGWRSVLNIGALDPAIPLYTLEKGVFAMWDEPGVLIRDARDVAAPATLRERFFTALRESGIVDITVVGVAADFCVRWAIDGLVDRGFRVTVPASMTRGIARQIDAVAADAWGGAGVVVAA